MGIKKQFASTIAGALLDLAEARPELLGEGGSSADGSGGGEERMVTLAVEGNISAGDAGRGQGASISPLSSAFLGSWLFWAASMRQCVTGGTAAAAHVHAALSLAWPPKPPAAG